MSELLLCAKNLYKEYKSGENTCVAVNHTNLEIYRSDFVTIIGPSGSGKSSLIYLLSGMTDITSGKISYMNTSITDMTDKQKAWYRGKEIGFVFQDSNLIEDLTGLQNVALPGYLYEKAKVVENRASKWLEILGISDVKDKYPGEMSGGQRQRVAIARSLINKPKLLFLDEPTGNLDIKNGESILSLLVNMNNKGQTIVMVTHDMNAAARGSTVITIRDGEITKTVKLGKYNSEQLDIRKSIIYDSMKEGSAQ